MYIYIFYYILNKIYLKHIDLEKASLGAQMVKNPPAMQETWVQSLCGEGPLE